MIREELKNLLTSFTEEDYRKNVDLHIHSNESDGKISPCEILETAKKIGMKYISITDHNTMASYKNVEFQHSNIIIPATEFDCIYQGVYIHILAYGIDINNEEIKQIIAKNEAESKCKLTRLFKLRDSKKVIEIIKKAGGISVLAHPACYPVINLDLFIKSLIEIGLEGIEVFYPYKRLRSIVKFHKRKTVYNIAKKYNLIMTGGSDFHGKIYSNFSLTNLSI